MSVTDLVGLLVLLAVFVFGPMFLMLLGSNRGHGSKPILQECPQCGAQNRTNQPRCYCCGHVLAPLESGDATATVIRRIREMDSNAAKGQAESQSPQPSKSAVKV